MPQEGPEPQEEPDEIVVTGRRLRSGVSQPDSQVRIVIRIDTDGTGDFSDIFAAPLRDLFNIATDFDIDEDFTAKQKEIIVTAIKGIANQPQLAPALAALALRNVDINIMPVTNPSEQLENPATDGGATWGLNPDGSVSPGATINIYISLTTDGRPATFGEIATRVAHELVHALGDPTLGTRLHADSDWASDIIRDIFRNYDFDAEAVADSGVQRIIAAPEAGGSLIGTDAYDVFAGSNNADTVTPGFGGSLIYSGLGDDRFVLDLGGELDVIVDDGGTDRLILTNVDPASVQTRWSDDGVDLLVSVNGFQEALFEGASGAGALEGIEIDGVLFATSAFFSAVNVAPWGFTHRTDVFGAFYGGYLGSGATSDDNFDRLVYQLGSVSGDYAHLDWRVDPLTGDIYGNFFKADRRISEYTVVTLVVSDGLTTSDVEVTIRWAYSLDTDPQPERAFVPPNETDVASGMLEYFPNDHLIAPPEFG